jgi:hypothetical protein
LRLAGWGERAGADFTATQAKKNPRNSWDHSQSPAKEEIIKKVRKQALKEIVLKWLCFLPHLEQIGKRERNCVPARKPIRSAIFFEIKGLSLSYLPS